ncbi:MAG: aminotransferase class I/II-fold pyridoxal phosphate-dependent enzyme [Methylococcales bacterium]
MKSTVARRMDDFSPFYVMELLQRAKELEAQGKEIIHMEVGEPDFSTPSCIVDAATQYIQAREVKYTAAAGLLELRTKISHFYQTNYNVIIDPQRIFITPGASGAFLLALAISLNAEEEVLMADPCYPCNHNFVRLVGAKTKFIQVNEQTDFQLSAELIKQHWTDKTKGVLIASPSNPTGTLISDDEFQRSIKQVKLLGGKFYSDEIYHGLVYANKARSALEFSDDVFVINSFSKYFGMTGWRIGWLVVPEMYVDAAERFAQTVFISTATHSQYAALAAFSTKNIAELESRKQQFEKRRDFLYENLIRLGFNISVKPEGAFYIYADCSRFTNDSFKFAKELLESQGVAVTPGKDFGNNNSNHYIRFAYTASIAKIAIGIQRLEKFICQ